VLKTGIHRLLKRVAKQVAKNDLFEQANERVAQEPIFESVQSMIQQSSFTEIEEAMLSVRLVNHWATWCAPCVEELEILKSIQDEVGPDKMMGISWELFQGESETVAIDEIVRTANSMGLEYVHHVVANDPDAFFEHFDLQEQVVPQTFVFSDSFELLFHRVGVLTQDDVEPLVQLIQGEAS
jgi:thiol-disulfide isomerase/thioredoxin